MLRLTKVSILVLAVLVLSANVSVAQIKGGRGGSGNSILPTTSTTKVVPTRVTPTQSTDPKTTRVIDPKTERVIVTRVIDPKTERVIVTRVIDPKTERVVVTKYTIVDPKTNQVVVTKVFPTQVIVNPVGGGFGWGNCGCACGCAWFTEILSYFGYEAPAVPIQLERNLRLHNDTDEKIRVYLRYHTQDVTGKWDWIPEAPAPLANKWVAFDLEPNEILEPKVGDAPIAANRIRIYAESATRSWKNFKDQDYWVVPEVTTAGEHLYYAPARETYQFYIHNNTK